MSGEPDPRAVDVDELQDSDDLFDRLGRRSPGPRDLDDPLVAVLAVMAGDVDLHPVPVSVSRRALSAAGVWPQPQPRDPRSPRTAAGTPPPVAEVPAQHQRGPLPADVIVPEVVAAEAIVPDTIDPDGDGPDVTDPENAGRDVIGLDGAGSEVIGPGTTDPGAAEPGTIDPDATVTLLPVGRSAAFGFGGPQRRPGRFPAHPRVVRWRPAIAVAAAAALIGGGVAVLVGGGAGLGGLSTGTMTAHLQGSSARPLRDVLTGRVDSARSAAIAGDATQARQILDDVNRELPALSPAERRAIGDQVRQVESLLTTASGAKSSGVSGSAAFASGGSDVVATGTGEASDGSDGAGDLGATAEGTSISGSTSSGSAAEARQSARSAVRRGEIWGTGWSTWTRASASGTATSSSSDPASTDTVTSTDSDPTSTAGDTGGDSDSGSASSSTTQSTSTADAS